MMIFETDKLRNSGLTVQEVSDLGQSRVKKQGIPFVHMTTRLGLAWGDDFFLQDFAIYPILWQ